MIGRVFWAWVIGCFVCAAAASADNAKYVILMIGDGMGLAQRTVAELFQNFDGNDPGTKPYRKLAMNSLPCQGLTMTWCRNSLITDSAAAGTAIAAGRKTNARVIGMTPEGERLKPIAAVALESGAKVGIVTTTAIDDATPASFYAAQANRSMDYEIAMELPTSGFHFFGGGQALGARPEFAKGRVSPMDAALKQGYRILSREADIRAWKPSGEEKIWAFSEYGSDLAYELDRPQDHLSLADFTEKALVALDGSSRGFFLMVEGGKIDKACHGNDAATAVRETLAFDAAIEKALAFYRRHPAETLIVVAADHETGGMSVGADATGFSFYPGKLRGQRLSLGAFGKRLKAWRDAKKSFAEILPEAQADFGLDKLTPAERTLLENAYASDGGQAPLKTAKGVDPFAQACVRLVSARAGVGWTSFTHTGIPTPISAIGVGAERFNGYFDNTEIKDKVLTAMGMTPQNRPLP